MDWELVTKLLSVCDGTGSYPKFKAIHDEAEAELVDLNVEASELLAERKGKADEEKAEADAKAQAERDKVKAEADAAAEAEAEHTAKQEEEITNARRA